MKRFDAMTAALAKSLGVTTEQLLTAFVPATAEDVPSVVHFRKQNLGPIIYWDDEKYLRWRYGLSHTVVSGTQHNILWMIKLKEKILAILGSQHMPIKRGESSFAAVHPVDVLVDASVAGVGLGAWMQFALNQKHDGMVIIGSNKHSAAMVKRIFHSMPNRQAWRLILNLSAVLSKHLRSPTLAKLIGLPIDPIIKIFNYRRFSAYADAAIEIIPLQKFPQEVEALSRSHNANFYHRPRTAEFLNWKFVQNPNVSYHRLGFYRDEKLIGYLVYRTLDSTPDNRLAALIEDFFWMHEENSASLLLENILAGAALQLMQRNIYLIQINTYGERAEQAAKRLGFIAREGTLLVALACNVSALEPDIYEDENWFLTEADAHSEIS